MLKVSKTKGGNVRINLDMDKLSVLLEALSYMGDETSDKMLEVIEDFFEEHNTQESIE